MKLPHVPNHTGGSRDRHTCKASATVSGSHHTHTRVSSTLSVHVHLTLHRTPLKLPPYSPCCGGLPVTVIEGSWLEQGGDVCAVGDHSSGTRACGMAYYRSNV